MYRYKSTFSPEENVMTFFFLTPDFFISSGEKKRNASRSREQIFEPNQ